MLPRRSLKLPITLAVVMIVLLAALTVGWVLLAVSGALAGSGYAGVYWASLTVGTIFMVLLIVGVVVYLVLSIKAINLSQRQSNFIDSVTHELKSPIASMKLYLQTLNHRQVNEAQQADFYRFMLEDVDRLDRLTNQMLTAGRLESGREDGELEDIELSELIRHCTRAVCTSYRVPLGTVEVDVEPCVLRSRRVDLDMLFRNLLDNAVKYAGNPPQVTMQLRLTSDGTAIAQIADNGRGIPPAMRRKIFGRFVRLGVELVREKPGTGLGLYIVRTIVRRLGGRVRVTDREPGPGTVFEVQLPNCRLPLMEANSELPEASGENKTV